MRSKQKIVGVVAVIVVVIAGVLVYRVHGKNESKVQGALITVSSDTLSIPDTTDVVGDYRTTCRNASQFGLDYSHSIEMADSNTTISVKSFVVDKTNKRGYVKLQKSNYDLMVWYDNVDNSRIAKIDAGDLHSQYTFFDAQMMSTPLGILIESEIDYQPLLDMFGGLVSAIPEDGSAKKDLASPCALYTVTYDEYERILPLLFLPEAEDYWSYNTIYFTEIEDGHFILSCEVHYRENSYKIEDEIIYFELDTNRNFDTTTPEKYSTSVDVFESIYETATE